MYYLKKKGNEPLPGGDVVVNVSYLDNPWVTDDQIAEAEYDKLRDYDKYKHVWLGGYQTYSDSLVFKNWKIEEFEAPPEAMHKFGSDFGFNSPTTLVRSHILGRNLYIDYEAYQFNCEIDFLPDLYHQVPESDQWPIIGDSARPEIISYLKRHGFPKVYSSKKGDGSIKEGVKFLQNYNMIVHPRCVYTVDELSDYRWKVDPNIIDPVTNKPIVLPILVDDKNHIIDPLRYAHEGHRRAENKEKNVHVDVKPVVNPMANRWKN